MNDNGERSMLERLLGLNWRTTAGGAMAAAGGVLAASAPPGKWQVGGQIIAAIGVAWLGLASRDRVVTGDQMQQVRDDKNDAAYIKAMAEAKAAADAKPQEGKP